LRAFVQGFGDDTTLTPTLSPQGEGEKFLLSPAAAIRLFKNVFAVKYFGFLGTSKNLWKCFSVFWKEARKSRFPNKVHEL